MTIALVPVSAGAGPFEPRRRTWSVAEFERFITLGIFAPDERLELIHGEIVEKVTQNPPHATALFKTAQTLLALFGHSHLVRQQMPLSFGATRGDRPEPDVAIVAGAPADYAVQHPRTALLVVEVSDTTLAYDRTVKAAVYAEAGIAEYWIVNLPDRLLEVHRQPARMTDEPFGHGYLSIMRYSEDASVTPLVSAGGQPASTIHVVDLLP
jgi:Uma2 family endonuclease